MSEIEARIAEMAVAARAASRTLAAMPTARKAAALKAAAAAIRADASAILSANAEDMKAAEARGTSGAMLDRLRLDDARLEGIAAGVEAVANLPDPVGAPIKGWTQPNGLKFEQVRVPLGVIGIIYESRPNVTVDAGALCLMSGNACILRGGSEALATSKALHAAFIKGVNAEDLPADAIQLVDTPDRAAVGAMLGAAGLIDIIIPRGGKGLVARVQSEARVPVLAHLDGICHVYIDRDADADKAEAIALNAKLRRTGICGAAETLLIDEGAQATGVRVVKALLDAGCEVRGDEAVQAIDPRVVAADEADWGTEYLDAIISAKVVDGVTGAAEHIARHGSAHTESIVTENAQTAERFLAGVDSAIVIHNASTQFADGGEFGFGAEIGIATGRLHARGPVALEGLTTYKTVVRGNGQVRP
ncbi:glutamate-5-semialdehyde dehydrogenase [Sphingosinicella microcystinivorans]|uniref:Gamma-glutamyl phosphate reductase n=1 Tax=Sphingosinicella microcystinivorans TaxID=335406 RepID=A0AAD1D6X7_SPHMI|nr:glutamate-5-semialdehyde dehydrogenase [Sphingosinicella microcystinivorans]RKS90981.1 glutamate-5-semialdehyde dehydrogenase [Sphingosinicella microcystinivorans]BBE33901.1 gamma-glutamyl phosphate reductase [Sphingosinicella microcystinivorans]